MKTLSSNTALATSSVVTKPIHLIQIDFSPIIRLSTYQDITYDGEVWSGGQVVNVSGIVADGRGDRSATIQIGNLDGAIGSLVLSQGVSDRNVVILAGDANAISPGDMELVFSGVIRSADVDEKRVSLTLTAQGSRTQMVPRRIIGQMSGFNSLLPANTKITVGTTTYTLGRR